MHAHQMMTRKVISAGSDTSVIDAANITVPPQHTPAGLRFIKEPARIAVILSIARRLKPNENAAGG